MRKLLLSGANPNYQHPLSGATPLSAAAVKGHASIVKRLLVEGADVYKYDAEDVSPLMHACAAANGDVVEVSFDKVFLFFHFLCMVRGCIAGGVLCIRLWDTFPT